MSVYILVDHGAVELKKFLIEKAKSEGLEIIDLCTTEDAQDDYPDLVKAIADKLADEPESFGIVGCGSGQGIAMAVNKYQGVRCSMPTTVDVITKSREHNNANCISLPGSMDKELAFDIVKAMINSPFSTEERHTRRVKKLNLLG
jgi:ribose 5-phosphate isomerase B